MEPLDQIFPLSVCLQSVGHECESCENAWTDQDAFWDVDSGGTWAQETIIGRELIFATGIGNFVFSAPSKALRPSLAYLFIMKFVQLGTQIKTRCEKKENIQKYTKSTL